MNKIHCVKCREEKETSLFPVNTRVRRGFDSWCKKCHKEYGNKHRSANIEKYRIADNQRRKDRINWLQSMKTKPCVDCGEQYEPHCMDFDHLKNKTLGVTRMVLNNVTEAKIIDEIAKCELVCVLCHNTRTQNRLDKKHPTKKYTKYSSRNIEIINQAKNKPCGICFQIREPHNMQLDHVNPDSKFKNVSQLKNFKVETLIAEIAKCQVICALCHRRKSIFEQQLKRYPKKRETKTKKRLSDIENRLKECNKCGLVKSFDLFPTHKKTKDGCNVMCKDCFNAYRRERRRT